MHLSPLGFAACQSKKCTNISLSAPILNPPTEFTEFTEQTGRGYSPTDFTDLHRSLLLRRNSHRFHGFTQMQANCSVNSVNSVGVFTLYKYLCGSVQSVGEYPLPVCSVCSVKSVGASLRLRGRSLLLRRDSHRIHRIHRSLLLRRDSHRIHRSLLLKRNSHRFHGFTQMQANCSVNSVNSVGVFTLYKYLCGSVQSVGEYPLPVCSVCSVKSVGASLRLRGRSLLLRRNSHRIHRIHRSLLLRRNSHRIHGFTQM